MHACFGYVVCAYRVSHRSPTTRNAIVCNVDSTEQDKQMQPLPPSSSSLKTRQKKMQTTPTTREQCKKGGRGKVFKPSQYKSKSFFPLWRTAFFSRGESAEMLSAFVQTVSSCAHTSHSLSSGLKKVLQERHWAWANVRVNTAALGPVLLPAPAVPLTHLLPVYLLPMDVHSSVPARPLPPLSSCSTSAARWAQRILFLWLLVSLRIVYRCLRKRNMFPAVGKLMSTGTLFFSSALGAEEIATPARRPPCLILNVLPTSHCSTTTSSPSLLLWCTFCEARGDCNFISTWAPGTVCVDLCIADNKHPLLLPRGTGAASHSAAELWQLYFATMHTTPSHRSSILAEQNHSGYQST